MITSIDYFNEVIRDLSREGKDTSKLSDGYHTFEELYDLKKALHALLYNEWSKQGRYHVHKSRLHNDGTVPFGNKDWFIVVAVLPTGQVSNHYHVDDWDLFDIRETPTALFPFDFHTTKDVIDRYRKLILG